MLVDLVLTLLSVRNRSLTVNAKRVLSDGCWCGCFMYMFLSRSLYLFLSLFVYANQRESHLKFSMSLVGVSVCTSGAFKSFLTEFSIKKQKKSGKTRSDKRGKLH